jgi:hypothetical protein
VSTAQSLNPQILGRAENAHRALLVRILAGTGVSYPEWVALSLVAMSGDSVDNGHLVASLVDALKSDERAARRTLAGLRRARLLEPVDESGADVRFTDEGLALYGQARSAVDETVARLYSGIDADDLATAGRVLVLLTARATAELEGAA